MSNAITIQPQITASDRRLLDHLSHDLDGQLDRREAIDPNRVLALATRLWEALASGIDGGFDALLEQRDAALAAGAHLRLDLLLDDDLRALPWELAFHADKRLQFLSRNPDFALVRRLRPPVPQMPELAGLPLRILLFIASPEDLDPERARLDFETEENFIHAGLDTAIANGEIEVDVAEDGALDTLATRLAANEYHILHLSMHGQMRDGEASLGFEQPDTGRTDPVTPDELIAVLKRGRRLPPCVVLSACQTAQPDTGRAIPSFAQYLQENGVPHVLGMRRAVADSAATHFAARLYQQLATGKPLDLAATLARADLPCGITDFNADDVIDNIIPQGLPRGITDFNADDVIDNIIPRGLPPDAGLQWSVPVLYSSKQKLVVADRDKPFTPQPRRAGLPKKLNIGELEVQQKGFIGRRAAIRRYYRAWDSGDTPHLLLYGIGGAGKTTLAGAFALRRQRRQRGIRLLAFTPPFAVEAMEEQVRTAFRTFATPDKVEKLQTLTDADDRFAIMLAHLRRQAPYVFIVDNLETCLVLDRNETRFAAAFAHVQQLIALLSSRSDDGARLLITCRYPLPADTWPGVAHAELPDASLGDVLRFMRNWAWPADFDSAAKNQAYRTLGGNFRAIEWLSGLLANNQTAWQRLQGRLDAAQPRDDTPKAALDTVRETMRRDLVFDELRALLPPATDGLLRRLALEPRAVIIDGVLALWEDSPQVSAGPAPEAGDPPRPSRPAGDAEAACAELLRLRLLERSEQLDLGLPAYRVPALVAELLAQQPLPADARRDTHARLGRFWRHMGEHVTRLISDDLAALAHFDAAGLADDADAMRASLSNLFFNRQEFGRVVELLAPFVAARGAAAPWWALNRLGVTFLHLGGYEAALPCFLQAEKLLGTPRSKEDKKNLGTTLNNISQIYDARGDYGAALRTLEQSLQITQEIGDRQGEGRTLGNIGNIYSARGDYDVALRYLEQSLKIRQEIGDRTGEGTTLNNLATTAYARGDYDAALRYLEQSLEITQEIGDRAGEGTTLNNISQIYKARGDYDAALRYLEQSRKITQEIGDRAGEGTTLNNISQIYKARGDYDAALRYLEQSLKIRQEIGDRAGEGATLNNLATTAYARGDYDAALRYLEQSLEITQEIGDRAGEGTTLNNISQIYSARGDYAAALRYLEQSLQIGQEIGDRAGEGKTLNNLATTAYARGDYDAALRYLEQSLKIMQEIGDRKGEGATLNNLATIAYARGDYDAALRYLEQSRKITQEIGDRAGMIPTLHNMAHIHLQNNDPQAALEKFAEALQLARDTQDAMGLYNVCRDLGDLLCEAGAKEQGLPLLEQALAVGQQMGAPDVHEVEGLLQQWREG